MPSIDTIRIVNPKHPEKFCSINAWDFNPAIHTLWEDRDVPEKNPAFDSSKPVDPEPVELEPMIEEPDLPRWNAEVSVDPEPEEESFWTSDAPEYPKPEPVVVDIEPIVIPKPKAKPKKRAKRKYKPRKKTIK